MKKKLFFLPIVALFFVACGEGASEEKNALDDGVTGTSTNEDFEKQAASFAEGGAKNANQYFKGVVAEVVEVDIKFREITAFDTVDAEKSKIEGAMEECLARIESARDALGMYGDADWNKKDEFHDLTMEWLASVEGLVVNYLMDLAEPMSRPDDTWSDEELNNWDEYIEAYKAYQEVDGRWVEYQYTFADANDVKLNDETIDVGTLVEEDLQNQ